MQKVLTSSPTRIHSSRQKQTLSGKSSFMQHDHGICRQRRSRTIHQTEKERRQICQLMGNMENILSNRQRVEGSSFLQYYA